MANLRVLGCAIGVLLCPGFACAAPAQTLARELAPARTLAGGDSASRDQLIEAVEKRYHARVVRVAETTVNGRPALELRLLSEQRVWNIVVDASSGQLLSGG